MWRPFDQLAHMIILRSVMFWFHLVAAVLAIGGVYFLRVILMPVVRTDGCEHAPALSAKVREKFRKLIWHAIAILIVSGGIMLALGWRGFFNGSIKQHLLELKIFFALVLFVIALVLTIPAKPSEDLRRKTPMLLLVSLFLGLIILLLAAVRHVIP